METRHRHTPQASTRARCPVCEHPVYSASGIHPQCAAKRNESPKPRALAPEPAEAEAETEALPAATATVPPPRRRNPWTDR